MSTEIPQHVPCISETATGEAQCAIEVSQIDRLSRLPPELLDFIFELAAETDELATIPPSRYLRHHHERALYRGVSIGNHETLSRLATTLRDYRLRGQHTRRITWKWGTSPLPFMPAKPLLVELSENVLESRTEIIAYFYTLEPGLIDSLRVIRLVDAQLSFVLVEGFSQLPNLRRVEFSFTDWDDDVEEEEEVKQITPSMPQVTEVVIRSTNYARETQIPNPSRLAQFFPNAAFVLIDLTLNGWGALYSVKKVIEQIPPTLRSLILRDRWNNNECDNPLIDELLSHFIHLRHLHLDPSLYSFSNLESNLAPLNSFVSLSLGFSEHLHHPSILVNAIRQLPFLGEVKLEYFGIEEGDKFDIELAELQLKKLGRDLGEVEELPALEWVDDLSEMKNWRFPFGWNASDTLLEVVDMEQQLKEELGLAVSSNLEQIRRAYHRQLVEFSNRETGSIYFYGINVEAGYAHYVAKQHGVRLPPLEIDLSKEELLLTDNLEWFKVDMTQIVGDGGGECIGLGLRYKEGVKLEQTEKSELKVAEGSNSSDDSADSGAR